MDAVTGAITLQNFATAPVGVALVTAIMFALDKSFAMTTRAKVLMQILISVLYAVVAASVFMTGDIKLLIQQGIILFCAVAFSQVFGYETFTKIAGTKGDGLPFSFFKNRLPNSTPVVVTPTPTPAPSPEPVPAPEPAKPADQGSPDGRI